MTGIPDAAATLEDFAVRTGAEQVMALLDRGDDAAPVLVERTEDGTLQVTDDGAVRGVEPGAALPLPDLRAVPGSALSADPETGELAGPLGSVQLLADSVLGLARLFGGRSVATATFPTRDPDVPLTIAAREGEPVVFDIAGRQFGLPE